jgi:hypothetical protein
MAPYREVVMVGFREDFRRGFRQGYHNPTGWPAATGRALRYLIIAGGLAALAYLALNG